MGIRGTLRQNDETPGGHDGRRALQGGLPARGPSPVGRGPSPTGVLRDDYFLAFLAFSSFSETVRVAVVVLPSASRATACTLTLSTPFLVSARMPLGSLTVSVRFWPALRL